MPDGHNRLVVFTDNKLDPQTRESCALRLDFVPGVGTTTYGDQCGRDHIALKIQDCTRALWDTTVNRGAGDDKVNL